MRITGGEFRGRRLNVPSAGHVRPTQDAVREAVFSMLADVVPGSVFLDLFAGSGAVGLDALSRGAASVVWVERDRRVAAVLQKNVTALGRAEAARIVIDDSFAWLKRRPALPAPVDIVFADPPYATEGAPDRMNELMAVLSAWPGLASGAIFVAEQRVGAPDTGAVPGWVSITCRRYGRTRIVLYKRARQAAEGVLG